MYFSGAYEFGAGSGGLYFEKSSYFCSEMDYFDFHHHHSDERLGIFNAATDALTPERFFSVGLHPMFIDDDWEKKFDFVTQSASKEYCVAIGECGFDARSRADDALQEKVFKAHLDLASALEKPMIIHCVKKYDRLISFRKKTEVPMIIHGFSKHKNLALTLVRHGFLLSFGARLQHSFALQESLRVLQAHHFFLETDDALMPISQVYEVAANVLGKEQEWVRSQIMNNLKRIGIHGKMVREK